MSTCWKCERPTPDGVTECERCAGGGWSLEDGAEIEALAAELKSGSAAGLALARHVDRMGAARFQFKVLVGKTVYEIVVMRKE